MKSIFFKTLSALALTLVLVSFTSIPDTMGWVVTPTGTEQVTISDDCDTTKPIPCLYNGLYQLFETKEQAEAIPFGSKGGFLNKD
ncbi:hypothetical protein [Flavivirga jejuensis]|uniref:Secreted protein n=1 Tax=Flavivirga jejuensis TaxID=870487 RepID=A0ABT8WRE9_9FLAO|nr:hypothetical protein [Flavivirga jejuensis]MDO5975721.1 hypothetical protein [Flavivirga jejuensis]